MLTQEDEIQALKDKAIETGYDVVELTGEEQCKEDEETMGLDVCPSATFLSKKTVIEFAQYILHNQKAKNKQRGT